MRHYALDRAPYQDVPETESLAEVQATRQAVVGRYPIDDSLRRKVIDRMKNALDADRPAFHIAAAQTIVALEGHDLRREQFEHAKELERGSEFPTLAEALAQRIQEAKENRAARNIPRGLPAIGSDRIGS